MTGMLFFHPKNTMFICRTTPQHTTVYEAGREHWYGKEGCTNRRYVASTPRTSGLCWLPSCSQPQSYVLIFSALILTIWSTRVAGTLCIADLSLCERVCVFMCVCFYVLHVCKMSQICSLVSVDLAAGNIDFVSICIFLPAKNTFISSTSMDIERSSDMLNIILC